LYYLKEIKIHTLLRGLFPSLDDLEHFFFINTPNLGQRDREFGRLFIPLVFNYAEVKKISKSINGNDEFDILALLKALAFVGFDLSSRYCGRGVLEGSAGAEDLTFRSSCALIRFLIWILS
jgi:hypothetical protein